MNWKALLSGTAVIVEHMRFQHQLLPPNTIFWEPHRPRARHGEEQAHHALCVVARLESVIGANA